MLAVGAIVVGLIVVAGALFFALGSSPEEAPTTAAATSVAHVHGLGVDPADGVLYAGTHYGLFRVPEDGEAALVGDRVQDFMGFTVAGPNHYLASGHPGAGQEGPSSLGLIQSTDGGQTWESVSLAGEADFHSLAYRHGQVYGFNALTGEFMVSSDMTTWDVRSQTPMASFSVSPEDPDVIVATTQQGLAMSFDSGRSFATTAGAPVFQLVAWAEDGTIFGVEPDGALHASQDDAVTWEARGELGGSPHALSASGQQRVFAAIEGAILASEDGGRTFTVRYEE